MSEPHTTPEQPKDYGEILAEEILQGLRELERPVSGLLLSGTSAGLDIGFSVFFMAIALSVAGVGSSSLGLHLLLAFLYSVGFIFVILGRSELFTEHTTLAVFPVLGGRAGPSQLARLWGLVYVANLAGAIAVSAIQVVVGPAMGTIDVWAFGHLADRLLEHSWGVMLLSAILAGWLMGLMSWLLAAAQDTLARILITSLVTGGIGLAGLHHCIVGSVEVLVSVFAGAGATVGDYVRFLTWSTLGNAVGGVLFVALIKYGHAVRRGPLSRPSD